jgi:hypothetical protein
MTLSLERLRFPVGPFDVTARVPDDRVPALIDEIAQAPSQLRAAVAGLTEEQLDTPYRPDGWTVRQVVHHLPDSHMNSLLRMKWALTEDEPMIKTYAEQLWAQLADGRSAPVDLSLGLLDALHARWVYLLESLSPEQLQRCFRHPEMGRISIRVAIAFYAWHGRHHIAHISSLREREGW